MKILAMPGQGRGKRKPVPTTHDEPTEPVQSKRSDLFAPMLMRPMPEYESPVTGKMITSRHERREDLKKSGCVEADPPKTKRGLTNPHFAAKHGVMDKLDREAICDTRTRFKDDLEAIDRGDIEVKRKRK